MLMRREYSRPVEDMTIHECVFWQISSDLITAEYTRRYRNQQRVARSRLRLSSTLSNFDL